MLTPSTMRCSAIRAACCSSSRSSRSSHCYRVGIHLLPLPAQLFRTCVIAQAQSSEHCACGSNMFGHNSIAASATSSNTSSSSSSNSSSSSRSSSSRFTPSQAARSPISRIPLWGHQRKCSIWVLCTPTTSSPTFTHSNRPAWQVSVAVAAVAVAAIAPSTIFRGSTAQYSTVAHAVEPGRHMSGQHHPEQHQHHPHQRQQHQHQLQHRWWPWQRHKPYGEAHTAAVKERLQHNADVQLYIPHTSNSSANDAPQDMHHLQRQQQQQQQQQQHCYQDLVPHCTSLLHTHAAQPRPGLLDHSISSSISSSSSLAQAMSMPTQQQLWHTMQQQQQQQQQQQLLLPPAVRTISWPGGGVLFFWQLGVMSHLYKVLPQDTLQDLRLIGSSSGALLAALAATGVVQERPQDVITAAAALCNNAGIHTRRWGLFGVWGGLLQQLLDQLLPENAADLCSSGRAAMLTTAFPWLYNIIISEYSSRDDVTQAVLASAHIPLLMDRQWSTPLVGRAAAAANGSSSSRGSGGHSSSNGSNGNGQPAAEATTAVHGVMGSRDWSGGCAPHSWMRTSLAIDGNFWYMMKQCYHGFAPPDGSAALVIEPQQDAVLQQLLTENSPTAAADTVTDMIAMSATGGYTYMLGQQGAAAATAAAKPSAETGRGRRRHSRKRMGSLRLVSEERAWQLFELGQKFGERAVRGEVTPLHIQLRPAAPGASTH